MFKQFVNVFGTVKSISILFRTKTLKGLNRIRLVFLTAIFEGSFGSPFNWSLLYVYPPYYNSPFQNGKPCLAHVAISRVL